MTAFLDEIESWRDVWRGTSPCATRASAQRDLNFAVQRTIDRIVFLRICEDRGIEPYGTLQDRCQRPEHLPPAGRVVPAGRRPLQLRPVPLHAEKDRPEPPDELTLGLAIDDKPLKEILRNLYFPTALTSSRCCPAEILGQVYEQFLGKVIRLTEGHQAKVEEKPEVRKAGGVYYTPAYIVDYIVAAHGRASCWTAKGKGKGEAHDAAQAAKLRILDPACGSGSFLIGAYQYLLDWHRDWYVDDDAGEARPRAATRSSTAARPAIGG